MSLIAAPARQWRTWSMWLTIAGGLANIALGLVQALSTLNVMSVSTFAVVNACLLAAIGAVKFIAQQIPVTTDEKIALVIAAATAPMIGGEVDVKTTVNAAVVSGYGPL